jgi:hypothetical protein
VDQDASPILSHRAMGKVDERSPQQERAAVQAETNQKEQAVDWMPKRDAPIVEDAEGRMPGLGP